MRPSQATTTSLAAAFALVASVASAQCRPLEFVELDSLARDDLLAMRCQYYDDWRSLMPGLSDANLRNAQAVLRSMNRCSEELTRIDRILARKYSIPGDTQAVTVEVNRRCRSR
jgi:hypothetical protein